MCNALPLQSVSSPAALPLQDQSSTEDEVRIKKETSWNTTRVSSNIILSTYPF